MKGIIRRGEKYVARPKVNGKQVWLGTFDTEEEAEEAILAGRDKRRVASGQDVSVSELTTIYGQQNYGRLEATTVDSYKRALANFEVTFGDRPADSLKRVEVQTWALDVPGDYLRTIRTVYQWARNSEIPAGDPTLGIRPRPVSRRHVPHVLTAAQVEALADASLEVHDQPEADYLYAQIKFAAGTGMRPGEIAALRFGDVDRSASEIHVQRSLTIGGVEKAPKNGHARRIVLTATAREALAVIPAGLPDQRVFQLPDGQALVKANLSRYFNPIRDHAGLAGYRFYDLRHTCATRLLEAGLPSYIVAIQLGHLDGGRLVEQIYGHPSVQAALDRIKQVATSAEKPPLRVAKGSRAGGKAA